METVMFGVVPVQRLQNRSRSTRVSGPAVTGVNVGPAHEVELNPKPEFVTVVFCWSMCGTLARITSPALAARSQFVPTPDWKSPCDVSVKQPLAGADPRTKFRVVVPPPL